jgi:hypothetical protein
MRNMSWVIVLLLLLRRVNHMLLLIMGLPLCVHPAVCAACVWKRQVRLRVMRDGQHRGSARICPEGL